MYHVVYAPKVKGDIAALKKEDKKLANRLMEITFDIFRDPYSGLGKPKALTGDYKGWYSRRLTDKHRVIYKLEGDVLKIISCYGHYDDK